MTECSMVLLVLSIALLSSIPLLSAAEDTYVIKPRPDTPCPILPQPKSCLTLSEYAREMRHFSRNTTLAFLPGQHSLDHDITVFNVTSFTMVGSLFSSTSSLGEPTTTISCIGPAALSFCEIQEVKLQAIEFVHCGDIHQPAIMVSSVQYFEMVECSLKDSRGVGVLANVSALSLDSTSFHNSSSSGLIIRNGFAKFTGNTTFTRNGNVSFIDLNSTCFAGASLRCGGGFAAVNSSVQFLGFALFVGNVARLGGGVFANRSTLVFQGRQVFEENESVYGGGVYALTSSLEFYGNVTLISNSASEGGGMNVQSSGLICSGSVAFDDNIAEYLGGGISVGLSSLVSFYGSAVFTANSAYQGGGTNVESSDLICNGTVTFDGNRAEVLAGGGLTASYGSSVLLYGSAVFTANSAYQGAGINVEGSDLICNGTVTFDSNTAEGIGGGLIASYGSSVSFYGSAVFTANTAYLGGGMGVEGSVLICNGTVTFDSNAAEGIGGGLIAYYSSSVSFYGSAVFTANNAYQGGGMGVQGSVLISNGSIDFESNRAVKLGGGISASYGSSVSFCGSAVFTANSAFEGGGMKTRESTIRCNGSIVFANNTVEYSGGGINGARSSLAFHGNATIAANTALQGGGMLILDSKISCDGSILFHSNIAQYSGGGMLVAFSLSEHIRSTVNSASYMGGVCTQIEGIQSYQTFKESVSFVNNSARLGGGIMSSHGNLFIMGKVEFQNNSALLSGDKIGYGGGIFSYCSGLYLLGDTTFSENTALEGGGVYGSKTTINIDGRMNVVNNAAHVNGGGFYLASGSECWVMENTSLLLANNHAGQFGGAVYIRDDPFVYCFNSIVPSTDYWTNCFLQTSRWPTTATIQIRIDNYAEEAGSGLYGGNLDYCRLEMWGFDPYNQNHTEVFRWSFPNITVLQNIAQSSFISSDPIGVCLCISNKPYCNVTEQQVTAFPGGTLYISVVAIGQKNGTVPSVITAKSEDVGVAIDSHQHVQAANKTCTTLEYRISPQSRFDTFINSTMTLHSESSCQSFITPLTIAVHLLPCPKGFQLSQTLYKSCICSKRVQQYTNTCDIDTQAILRHGQYWIGWDSTSNGAVRHPHCPFDYCRSGNTSFPMNDTDRQCQHNRAGLLCGGCMQGHSIAFGSSRCLRCSTNSYVSLLLPFTLAGVVLVVFLLTCKLTVAVGTINGLVFYANIVAANQALYFPKHNSEGAFLRVFIAWINLDLGIETCFYNGMDMYTRTWLQFVFPLYIWTLVGTVIALSHYFSWATQMFGRNPVAVLATLFLLSYAKLLRTIITAMSFTYLDYPDNPRVPVWLHDGNVGYLEGKHIAIFVAALVALLFVFLPYTLVIFFGQWIEARSQRRLFRWISDYRVKAFLDAYHGPLKSNHRYWPGLLLVSRAVLLLVFAFNPFGDTSINLLATITCIVGLLTLLLFTGTVYNNVYLYILEVSFLVNCLFLAAGTMAPALTEENQLALTYTSVGIAFTTFIGILVYHILTQVRDSRVWKDMVKPWLQCRQRGQPRGTLVELDGPAEGVVVHPKPVVTTTVVNLRELVLEDEQNQRTGDN